MSRLTYSLDGRLGKVIARGAKLRGDVAASVLRGDLTLSTSEVSTLTLVLTDTPNFRLARERLFDAGTLTKAGSRVDYGGLKFEVRAVELGPRGDDHTLTVTARSLGACRLRRTVAGANIKKGISPTQYAKLAASRANLKLVGQPSASRKNVGRHKGETEWEALQRLAGDLGFVCFEAAGVLYFGKPTWLIQQTKVLPVRWRGARTDDAVDALPTCRRSGDDKKRYATVSARLRGKLGEDALPGMCLRLTGVPLFEADYMVETVTIPLAENQPATVSAGTAVNPTPTPKIKSSSGSSSGGDGAGDSEGASGTAAAFVRYALEQAGDTYIYGAEAAATDPDPDAFDCSELVQWAAARAGVAFTDGSAAQIAACRSISVAEAISTRGALLYHPGHIAISLGTGRTIEAANSRVGVVSYSAAGRFTAGGLIPGMRY